MGSNRVVAIGDLHCGHWSGITPTGWHLRSAHPARQAWQRESWEALRRVAHEHARPRVLIVLGDAVCLTDPQWGAGEQVEGDPLQMRTMAVQAINLFHARKVVIVRGTARHVVAGGIDVEDLVAEAFDTTAHDHAFVEVDGYIIDAKHHVGRTQTDAALLAEVRANREWAELGVQPRADAILRGHVHEGRGTMRAGVTAMTLPALQGWTTYGARRCRWPVHWGYVWSDIDGKPEDVQWHIVRQRLDSARSTILAC